MHALIDFAAVAAQPGSGQGLSSRGSPATQLAFGAPRAVLYADALDQVRSVLDAVEQHAQAGRWCVGFVRYEAAPAFDAALTVHPHSPGDGPLVWFGVHDAPLDPPPTPDHAEAPDALRAAWQSGMERAEFDADITQLHQAIAEGVVYQANYTTRIPGSLHSTPQALFEAMRRAQPGGFAAYIDTGTEQVLSVSPELFFDWQDGHLVTRPMKGTAARARDAQADADAAHHLRTSPKERAENVMIVDLIRNDLSRIALPFSVQVDGLFRVQALPTVWQMVSDVHADTRPGTRLADVFGALFPCGSVTGAPKVQAMRLIRALEPSPRGVYCGAVGVVRPGGSATFNVPIRTVLARQGQLWAGTGSGITSDATAEGEWQEWRHKQTFLQRASQGFALLETLGLQDGALPAAPDHLARMAASARHFGYRWDADAAQAALASLAQSHPVGHWRVRLLLDAQGHLTMEALALAATPASVRLQLAPSPLPQAHSEFVRHKTTRRAHYDAFAPTDAAVFDTVLWNRAGEVTECTRGNIALRLDGRWVTPAAHCGLLAGVGRAHWLAQGRLQEAVVHLHDLPRVQELAFLNSLRGWVPAVWDSPCTPTAKTSASPHTNCAGSYLFDSD